MAPNVNTENPARVGRINSQPVIASRLLKPVFMCFPLWCSTAIRLFFIILLPPNPDFTDTLYRPVVLLSCCPVVITTWLYFLVSSMSTLLIYLSHIFYAHLKMVCNLILSSRIASWIAIFLKVRNIYPALGVKAWYDRRTNLLGFRVFRKDIQIGYLCKQFISRSWNRTWWTVSPCWVRFSFQI